MQPFAKAPDCGDGSRCGECCWCQQRSALGSLPLNPPVSFLPSPLSPSSYVPPSFSSASHPAPQPTPRRTCDCWNLAGSGGVRAALPSGRGGSSCRRQKTWPSNTRTLHKISPTRCNLPPSPPPHTLLIYISRRPILPTLGNAHHYGRWAHTCVCPSTMPTCRTQCDTSIARA